MGSSQSKNVSDAVTNVTSNIEHSTVTNNSQVNSLQQNVNFNSCFVKADKVNIQESAKFSVKNSQIASAMQNASVANDIQQKMMQEAASTVGVMGIGFADASNTASMTCNATTNIIDTMKTASSQGNWTSQGFTCNNSYINSKEFDIILNADSNYLSDQTVKNDQVANIINNISQVSDQKAIARVEGIGSLLIFLVIIIAIFVLGGAKVLSSKSAKIVVIFICILLFGSLILGLYLKKSPPFEEPNNCISNSNTGCQEGCVNQQESSIILNNPPLKYLYGITPSDASKPGGNLIQMVISANQGDNKTNGGYRGDIKKLLDQKINNPVYISLAKKMGIPNIPNPLIIPMNKDDHPYLIPIQYSQNTSSTDSESGKCTPSILQISIGSTSMLSSCPNNGVDPSYLSPNTSGNDSNSIANLNSSDWIDYMNMNNPPSISNMDTANNRALFARFVLNDLFGINNMDMHIYINENEPVRVSGNDGMAVYDLAKNQKNNAYQFIPTTSISSYKDGMTSGGTLKGQIGSCNTRQYKVNNFFWKGGYGILIGIFVFAIGFLIFSKRKEKEKNNDIEMAKL